MSQQFKSANTIGGAGTGFGPFLSAEITGNGAAQPTAHGRNYTPTIAFAFFSDLTGGAAAAGVVTISATTLTVTVTNGEKYKLFCM